MNKTLKIALCAALPLLGAAGCNDFLTSGEEVQDDPNRPLTAGRAQLFSGAQALLWFQQTGEIPRATSMWVQQMLGTDRQYILLNNYEQNESTFDFPFGSVYAQGGLVDIRRIQNESREVGDSIFLGIAQVMEALTMGTAADLWGDVPYSQALDTINFPTPALDEQLDVYNRIQLVLDTAFINLASVPAAEGGSANNVGPEGRDLVYGGDPALWTALAHTLKARYYFHVAEVDPNAYALALPHAQLGIATPEASYTSIHSGAPGEENLWYQFIYVQRAGYISPNPAFAEFLEARSDPRLSQYFDADVAADVTDLSAERGAATFSQPIVTYEENALMWAEAAYRTGDEATAISKLNEVKAAVGSTAPTPSGGPALLAEILTEKYIALFQNLEAWNDYKRTCWPNLAPVVAGRLIPARLFYGTSERQTNPNIPDPSQQPLRNDNDPANATDVLGNECLGQ